MKLTKALILLLTFIAIFNGCSTFTTRVEPLTKVFEVKYDKPMNVQAMLDTSNYIKYATSDTTDNVIKIKRIIYISKVFNDDQWIRPELETSVILFPIKQNYPGVHYLELHDIDEVSGEVLFTSTTIVAIYYDDRPMILRKFK